MASSKIAITGGTGFIGRRLANKLLEEYNDIIVYLLDNREPSSHENNTWVDRKRVEFMTCDIRDYNRVKDILVGVSYVFHLASYGMSSSQMLNEVMINDVNINGTRNIIRACQELGVQKLIYCSTFNTIYTGRHEIAGLSEIDCPYPKHDEYYDHYSRTKATAEKEVLTAGSERLSVVVLRPSAIYGDGEQRHLPRIVDSVRRGFLFSAIGNARVFTDWIYVDNLVHAFILAERSLPKHSKEVYFVSDDKPVNSFEFLSRFTTGLGYNNCFKFYVPTMPIFYLSWLVELAYKYIPKSIYEFTPFFIRTEVLKVGVTNYANIDKAKQVLGYTIQVEPDEAMRRCIEWFSKRGYGNSSHKSDRLMFWFKLLTLFILLILCIYKFITWIL